MSACALLVAVLLGCLTPAGPAGAAPGVTLRAFGVPHGEVSDQELRARKAQNTALAAQAQAEAAAETVTKLTQQYTDASAAVAAGLAALSSSFSDSLDAEQAADAAREQVVAARDMHSRQIKAVYSSGGSIGLVASVLAADTPEELMWRMSTASRVMGEVVHRAESQVELSARELDVAARDEQVARSADRDRARAVEKLDVDASAAQAALADASATLERLSRTAREARAAQVAAHELALAQAAVEAARRAAAAAATAMLIPAQYEAAYRAASHTCAELRWTLLAAIGQVESGHGRNNGPSSAGAIGPMQFMPGTFAIYGLDGDGDGVSDAWDPQDAIWSAANYLCSQGAAGGTPDGTQRALLAYNHAQWYVDLVLATERAISARETAVSHAAP